jgi:DNA-binding response OmpR family regulator
VEHSGGVTRPVSNTPTPIHSVRHLSAQERALYDVLAANAGRVMSRQELARRAGLADLSPRRCDSLIVGIRRSVGADRVRTVRRRGWMLVD